MVDLVALTLRYLHIVFGVAWIGGLAYIVGVLRIALPRADPPASQGVTRQIIPIAIRYVPFTAAMTILFGAVLYLYIGVFDPAILLGSNWGLLLLAALILTLATFAFGLIWGIGSSKKILIHLNEEACDHREELMGLQRRFNRVMIAALFLGLIIIGMMVYVVQAF